MMQSMSGPRLSTETVHASTVALEGRAVLITGLSGSGKSDLALRLLDRGFALVSDDRTIVRRDGPRLIASAPPNIAGKLEIRGIGIVDLNHVEDVPVSLLVELSGDIQRMPDEDHRRAILGVDLPAPDMPVTSTSRGGRRAPVTETSVPFVRGRAKPWKRPTLPLHRCGPAGDQYQGRDVGGFHPACAECRR